jgi:hypothetical protein
LLLAAVSENERGVILPAKPSKICPRALAAPLRALDHACEFAMPRDFVLVGYTIGLLIVAGGMLFTLYRLLSQVVSTAILWTLSGVIFVSCYSYRSEVYDVGKWLFAKSTTAHTMRHGATETASVSTREILESMRRSMMKMRP